MKINVLKINIKKNKNDLRRRRYDSSRGSRLHCGREMLR